MNRAIIISQKFNFGHLSGLMAWNCMLTKLGYDVKYFIDYNYGELLGTNICISNEEIYESNLVVIFNISTKDAKLIRRIKKKNKDLKVIFIYHEPWRGLSNELVRYSKDFKNFLKQCARKMFARQLLLITDIVICPSQEAMDIYSKSEAKINNHYILFPLTFKDEFNQLNYIENKKYFSFISTATVDKGIDCFFEFIKYASKLDDQIVFQVVTSSSIDKYVDEQVETIIKSGRLVIKQNQGLSEDEMNDAYNKSKCTWLAYRSSTQSGVIAKSFMWGSPCIATPVGVFKNVIDGSNGKIVTSCNDFESILSAYYKISNNQINYQNNARLTFNNLYNADNRVKDLRKILEEEKVI